VIVGRCADYYLRERKPFRIFVYANMASRVQRCMARSEGAGQFTEKEIMRHIRRIDRQRARYYNDTTGQTWGDKRCYDLCVNTSILGLDETAKFLAEFIRKKCGR
jgi:cytidylate kinase